ncbi:MAG: PEFG-CTERM sorting domain-containing protein [Thaumarchaeota archaeon]|nr:PEFG-CTERM sorting domain-containing protein [Nitrososphaerota archaeon]
MAAPVALPVFGQTPVTNPKGNQTTAYDLLQQEANQTGVSKATLSPLAVNTDLPTYNQGDTIVITGHVRDTQNATAVTLRVFNSLKNMISVAQLVPSADGSFTKTFLATGPLWKLPGNYTIVAQYGLYTNTNSTFHYNGGDGSSSITKFINATYSLQSGGQTFNIPYIIKGGTVSSMNILAPQYTLEVTLNTNADGSITLTLPRNMIDAKVPPPPNPDANLTGTSSGYDVNQKQLEDDKFIVTVNGKQVTQFTETKNQYARILSIPFHNGDSKIDIMGTVIVPEFGPIAALVLAIAIISIIAVSAKTGLRFMPKY